MSAMRNKKFIYPLVLTLLLSIMGVTVTKHVCAMEEQDDQCGTCASTMPKAKDDCKQNEKSCCKTIHERIAMKEDATILKSHNLSSPLTAIVPFTPALMQRELLPTTHSTFFPDWSASPPPLIEHIVLRI